MNDVMYMVEELCGAGGLPIATAEILTWLLADPLLRAHVLEQTQHWPELDDEDGPYIATFHYVPITLLLDRLVVAAAPTIAQWLLEEPEQDQ